MARVRMRSDVKTFVQGARLVDVRTMSDDPRGQAKLDQLHFLALSVTGDVQVRKRREKTGTAIIYEVPQLLSQRQKNLMTVWPGKTSVRLRIIHDEPPGTRGEVYDPEKRHRYLERLMGLYEKLRAGFPAGS